MALGVPAIIANIFSRIVVLDLQKHVSGLNAYAQNPTMIKDQQLSDNHPNHLACTKGRVAAIVIHHTYLYKRIQLIVIAIMSHRSISHTKFHGK